MNEPDNAVFRMARIELCKRDIQEMAKVAGLPPLPPHGLEFARLIREAQARGEDILILASVGCLKSTVMNLLALQDLLEEDPHILFASRSWDVVKATTREMARVIKILYGRQGEPWEAHKFNVPGCKPGKWPSCYGVTTGQAFEGTRADKGYPDDPIDDKSVKSHAYRSDSRVWYQQKYYTRLNPGATVSTIGSPWYIEDLYMDIIKNGTETHAFPARSHPCPKIYERFPNFHWHGDDYPTGLLWPEHYTQEFLDLRRKRSGPSSYAQRYLCDPTALLGNIFKLEWFRFFHSYDDIPPLKDLDIRFGIDLADSKAEDADETAITVMGIDRANNKIYVLDCVAGKWEGKEFETKILFDLVEKWNPTRIVIEKTGQMGRISYLKANTMWPIHAQDTNRNKADRFRTLETPIENQRIEFYDNHGVHDMVHQGVMFDPDVDRGHDDMFDSFEIGLRSVLHQSERPEYVVD